MIFLKSITGIGAICLLPCRKLLCWEAIAMSSEYDNGVTFRGEDGGLCRIKFNIEGERTGPCGTSIWRNLWLGFIPYPWGLGTTNISNVLPACRKMRLKRL